MRRLMTMVAAVSAACGSGSSNDGDAGGDRADASPPGEVVTVSSITDHGVTWTFAEPVEASQFVTGDWYVIGGATVVEIDPAPGGGRNGSVLNIPPVDDKTGFDDRTIEGRYDASLAATLPIALSPGDRLASSISLEQPGQKTSWLREDSGETSVSPVKSVSVLTCLADAAPADALRPSYADPDVTIYALGDADWTLLPALDPPESFDPDMLEDFAERLSRPWIDNLYFGFDAQEDFMAMYGREMGRVAGIASLFLMLELDGDAAEAQERLRAGILQRGVDLYGLVRAGHPGWGAFGGHGSGRKWPIVFAGVLLGDEDMASVSQTSPDTMFGEDMHTAFAADIGTGPAWTGDDVVYTGQLGIWQGEPRSGDFAWGPYEHVPPADWTDDIGESYRRCCTSIAWVGQALAARLVGAQAIWAHDAFFAYVDRWMDPTGDADDTQLIFDETGYDFRAGFAAEGQAWDDFVEEMWAAYAP